MDVNAVTNGANQVSILTNAALTRQRYSGLAILVHVGGHAEPDLALCSNPAQSGVGSLTGQTSKRRQYRRGREQGDQFGADRSRPPIARPDPGAGAEPGRSARCETLQFAIGSTTAHGGYSVGVAIGFHARPEQLAGKSDSIDLTYTNSAGQQQQVQIVAVTAI